MKIKNLLICLIIITIYSCSNSDNVFDRVIQEPKKPENPLELYVYHLIELSYFLDQFKLYHKEDGKWISKFGNDYAEMEYKTFPKDERLAEEPPFNLGRKVNFKFGTDWYYWNDGMWSTSTESSSDYSREDDANTISFEEAIVKYNLTPNQIHYFLSQHLISIEVCGCMEGDELFEGEVEYYVKNGSPWEQKFSKYQESQSLSFIDFPFFNSQFLSHEKMNLMRVLKLLQPTHYVPSLSYYGSNYDLNWKTGFSPASQWNDWGDLQEIMKELKRIVSNLESLSNEILSEDFNESIKLNLHNRQINTQIVDFEHGVQDTLYLLGGSLNNNRFYPFDADGFITAYQLKHDIAPRRLQKLDYTLPNNNINDLSNTLASLEKPYDIISKDDVFTFSKNLTVDRVEQFANHLGIIVEEVKSWKKEDIMTDLIGQTFTGTVSMGNQLETSCEITVYEYERWVRFKVNYSVTSFSGNTSSSIEKYELKIPSRYNNEESGLSGRDIVKFENGKYGVSFPVKSLTEGGVEYGKGSNVTILINTKGNLQLSLGNNNVSYNGVTDKSSSRLFEMLTKINE